ncbi:DUF1304 domain-containing protein [Enterococcus gilvus]|uniref:DUF1304 domain-containing protein n=1 Tax=Enterococcus gilvus TaxID=160453 RepID=UPI003D6AEBD1
MSLLTTILTLLVALEFFYIMYLETFATTSKATSKVFRMSKDELNRKSVATLFKNQGIYNGLLGIGLIYSIFSANAVEINRLILCYIILVALYGSLTSDKKIIVTQGGLAILTLLTTFF